MKKSLQKDRYNQLVEDITELYDCARRALVEAYWQIGKRIVEQEQQGETNAIYGDHLLTRLSEDLMDKLGSGFSKSNLYNMRRFYLAHAKNLQHAGKLTWTQHVALLSVKNSTTRQRLERKIASQKLTYEQIRQTVQDLNQSNSESSAVRPGPVPSLACIRVPLHTYALVDKTKAPYPRGKVVVDCGFNIWRKVPRNQIQRLGKASYTYPARVESVIDGDTIWALIDCGFDTFIREKLRFHGIDTPELGTVSGEKARRYVRRTLKASPQIVVRTHSYDKYARYLADIFYLPGESSYERICSDGLYLNQALLDKGLAQPMS
jgi:endonuclease YncB( thermonuclease family)